MNSILNQVINQYTGSISNVQSGSADIGLGLFNTFAAMAIALLALNHLLRKNVDMVDSNLELIKLLIYLNFFYYFIVNYNYISGLFFDAVGQIGNLLGAKASGLPDVTDIKAQNIFHIGFIIAKSIWNTNVTFNLLKDFQMILIAVGAGAVVLYCFAVVGLELILVQIGSKIILAGGIFLLAFSGLSWTRDYAERYVHTFFHIGIKIIFIYILIGLGLGLGKAWVADVPNTADVGVILEYDIGLVLSAYVYYKLCLKLPDQAVSYLTGRLSMGFETASGVNTAIKTVAAAPAAAAGVVAGAQGLGKAVSLAAQVGKANLQEQGKKINFGSVGVEAVKTLGAAGKVEWDKKVDETKGGKLAKNILAAAPKPKDTQNSTDSKLIDYSI